MYEDDVDDQHMKNLLEKPKIRIIQYHSINENGLAIKSVNYFNSHRHFFILIYKNSNQFYKLDIKRIQRKNF